MTSLSIPGATPANFQSWARDVIAAALNIKVNRASRDTDVWILAKTGVRPAVLVEPSATKANFTSGGWSPATPPAAGGSLKLTYSDVPFIAQFIESALKKPVLDETGIAGKYDFDLSYDQPEPDGAIEALRRAGFKVQPARRPIEFLVVTRSR